MKSGINYKQKDIVLIPFPYSDLTSNKLRPALIISNDKLNKTSDRICCLVTSKKSYDSIEIKPEEQLENKLPFESFIKPHRLFTVDTKIIKKKITKISSNLHNKVIYEINTILFENN